MRITRYEPQEKAGERRRGGCESWAVFYSLFFTARSCNHVRVETYQAEHCKRSLSRPLALKPLFFFLPC